MEEDRTTFETLEAAFVEGRLSRRDLLRRSALIGASAAAAHLLGSLGLARPAHAQGTPKKGGTLVIAKESELDILDPHSAGGWVTWRVSKQMHEGLIDEDLTQDNVPIRSSSRSSRHRGPSPRTRSPIPSSSGKA